MPTIPKSVKTLLIAGDATTIARERIADAAAQADAEGRAELSEVLHNLWRTLDTLTAAIGQLAEEELKPSED